MIFGFGKKKQQHDGSDDEIDEVDDVDFVLFQGALNGKEANLNANARLAQAGLIPAKEIITDALSRRCEQLRIEPRGERAVVQLMIDGVAHAGGRLSKPQGHAITQMMKLLSGLDVQQRQRAQSGGLRAELAGTTFVLQVQTTPLQAGGERLAVKIRNLALAPKSPEDVGFSTELKERVRELTSEKKGIFLVCGGPGSGVSTTTFGVLRCLDAYQYTVFTVGDTQGWELPNLTNSDRADGESLDTLYERLIRSEADVIYVDPLRNAENVQLLLKMQSRVTFIAEFPVADAISGIVQFAKIAGDNRVAAEALIATMSQRLIRTLCKDCRLAYRPNPKILAKIGLPPETKTLYRSPSAPQVDPEKPGEAVEYSPCETCGGTGYVGRTAMFELVEITEGMRQLVAAGKGAPELKALSRKEGKISLQQEGLKLVVEGKTSLEELQRVFQPRKA
ncbi:MAG TPA: ATPase, T2SS/T4P/T4SS family [Planctomycetaceae bacterium]|nr:ATPase, T2SS/T4P/T4SS family [Planctomycetaceae bacterium]